MAKKPAKTDKDDLRKSLFAALYVGACKLNGTEAAARAGYGGTRGALAVRACELLKDPAVRDLITRHAAAVDTTSREVLATLVGHMRGTMADFIRMEEGEPVFDFEKATERNQLHLVKRLKVKKTRIVMESGKNGDGDTVSENTEIGLELYGAQEAAVHVGKLLGMYQNTETPAHAAPDGQMTDEQLVEFYRKNHVPEVMWIPGVLRMLRAGKIKQVASKVLTRGTARE